MKPLRRATRLFIKLHKYFIQTQQMKNPKNEFREAGQTAILSVVFFSIVMTVITVSFMKTVSSVQSAATNNELQASAVAAAESGVEDGKRVLAYCSANPNDANCVTVNNPTADATLCNGAKATAVTNILKNALHATNDANGNIKMGVTTANTESYSCLVINGLTADYTATLSNDGRSEVIPLNIVKGDKTNPTGVSYVVIQWSNDLPLGAINSDHINQAPLNGGLDFPTATNWGGRPDALRVELSNFASGDTLTSLTNKTNAVTVRPTSNYSAGYGLSGSSSVNGNGVAPTLLTGGKQLYDLSYFGSSTNPNVARPPVLPRNCSSSIDPSTGNDSGYYCNIAILIGGSSSNQSAYDSSTGSGYYLRLQSIYNNSTHVRVTAYDPGGGQTLYFNGLQPSIDSTGRAADAFYRVSARVERGANAWSPDFAVDSGQDLCKNMSVYRLSGSDLCN
ncbi:MAG: hypothetical protein WAW91_02255 [Candidatus Nanoperiomorbaceae bacterium]